MLPFKYLFENEALAKMMVNHYNHDNLEYFKYFRISSNAVYPYSYKKKTHYLRLTPALETTRKRLDDEIEFIQHLNIRGYTAVEINLTHGNSMVIEQETPFGKYFAISFKGVPGDIIESLEMNDQLAYEIGKSLGKLHNLSREYKGASSSYKDYLAKMMQWFELYGDESEIDLCKKLIEYPIHEEQLILVHYDFQPDNLFYDGKNIHVIDFNDMMMHLPEMDLLCCFKDVDELFHEMIIKGYEDITHIKLSFEHHRFLNDFDQLFSRYRMKRAMSESWINEPTWMAALRKKFEDKLKAPL